MHRNAANTFSRFTNKIRKNNKNVDSYLWAEIWLQRKIFCMALSLDFYGILFPCHCHHSRAKVVCVGTDFFGELINCWSGPLLNWWLMTVPPPPSQYLLHRKCCWVNSNIYIYEKPVPKCVHSTHADARPVARWWFVVIIIISVIVLLFISVLYLL